MANHTLLKPISHNRFLYVWAWILAYQHHFVLLLLLKMGERFFRLTYTMNLRILYWSLFPQGFFLTFLVHFPNPNMNWSLPFLCLARNILWREETMNNCALTFISWVYYFKSKLPSLVWDYHPSEFVPCKILPINYNNGTVLTKAILYSPPNNPWANKRPTFMKHL